MLETSFTALGGDVHMAHLGHIGGDGGGGLQPPGGDRRWRASRWSRVPGGTCVRIVKRGRRNENVAESEQRWRKGKWTMKRK